MKLSNILKTKVSRLDVFSVLALRNGLCIHCTKCSELSNENCRLQPDCISAMRWNPETHEREFTCKNDLNCNIGGSCSRVCCDEMPCGSLNTLVCQEPCQVDMNHFGQEQCT